MDKLLPAEKAKVKVDFTKFYSTVISYIEKWFDLSTDNVMMKLRPIGLFETLRFSDLEEVAAALKLTDTLNMDKLYEEFCASQEEMKRHDRIPKNQPKVGKANLTNLFQRVSFVLSVPGSNAFVERIFSLMANKWSDARNRCSTDLIKTELQISVNMNMPCKDFFLAAQKDKDCWVLLGAARNRQMSFSSQPADTCGSCCCPPCRDLDVVCWISMEMSPNTVSSVLFPWSLWLLFFLTPVTRTTSSAPSSEAPPPANTTLLFDSGTSLRNCSCSAVLRDCDEALANSLPHRARDPHRVAEGTLGPGGASEQQQGRPFAVVFLWNKTNGQSVPGSAGSADPQDPQCSPRGPYPHQEMTISPAAGLAMEIETLSFDISSSLRVTFLDVAVLNGLSALKAYSVLGPLLTPSPSTSPTWPYPLLCHPLILLVTLQTPSGLQVALSRGSREADIPLPLMFILKGEC
ncbi:hypothetical protein F7725_001615 [Dissostichus mawsoni]|uniref:HAT C-terminal dimerisation domain-containing protein n=1 Tax=Dissostichus mawsoni TaxID=36200 RepID=A0A7J5Y059_DISMA|nr:hypothetical protein F7725_001615 [Dissostichus mawsoni]